MSDNPKIYVADLEAYNNGKLKGEWLDLTDYSDGSEVLEAIEEIVGENEYAIHDYENFPSDMYSEYMGESEFDDIFELIQVSESSGLPIDVISEWVNDTGGDVSDVEDAYYGEYSDKEDFAYQLVDEGVLVPDSNSVYISETDRRLVAGEEADFRVDDIYDEKELVQDYGDMDAYEEAEEEEDENRMEEILDEAKEKLREEIYDDWYDGLEDPIEFLVNEQGLYSEEDALKQSFIQVDYQKLADELEYDFTFIDGDGLYVFNNNYAKGGKVRSKRSINTDRARLSQEPWEQAYKSKRKGTYYAEGGRIVGNYYYDTRFDKPFRVLSEDGDKIGIEYIDKKNQSTESKTIKRDEFDYNVKMGAWNKYTQPFTYAKGGSVDEVIMIKIGGDKKYPYYIKKIDTTHISMANNKDGVDLVVPSHILQHKGESYYDDVRSWLKGGTSPNGKSYDSDYYAKGGSLGKSNIAYIDAIGSFGTDDDSWDLVTDILKKHNIEVNNNKDWHTKGYAEELYEDRDGKPIFTIKLNMNDSPHPKKLEKEISNLPSRINYQFSNDYAKGGKTNWVDKVVDSPNFDKGSFSAKAEKRGMSSKAFMKQVLHSPSEYDETTRKQAQFMKNAFKFEHGGEVEKRDEAIEFIIPSHYASAIINGDTSGLDSDDESELNSFIDDVLEEHGNAMFMLGDKSNDTYFSPYNDINNMGSDVTTLYLIPSNQSKQYAVGGEVIYTDLSDNTQSRKIWESRKSKNMGQNSFGSFAHRLNGKYLADYYLYRLDDFDENYYKHIKLKDGEILARVETDDMVGGEMPLVKLNLKKGFVHFMTDSEDDKNPKFDRSSAKVIYLSLDKAIQNYAKTKGTNWS